MDKAITITGSQFSDAYKQACFLAWYKAGQPNPSQFLLEIEKDELGRTPSIIAIRRWVIEWKKSAERLDLEIEQGIIDTTIAEKVAMLNRHIDTAKDIQKMAMQYLEENKKELTPNVAVRLLQLGLETERNSVGIPDAIRKLNSLDDESLLEEITGIIKGSDITIESLETELEDADSE